MQFSELTRKDKRAARAFRRVFAERTRDYDEAEMLDAQFDGGEWSGPIWARNWETAADASAEYVAVRFRTDVNRLLEAVFVLTHYEVDRAGGE